MWQRQRPKQPQAQVVVGEAPESSDDDDNDEYFPTMKQQDNDNSIKSNQSDDHSFDSQRTDTNLDAQKNKQSSHELLNKAMIEDMICTSVKTTKQITNSNTLQTYSSHDSVLPEIVERTNQPVIQSNTASVNSTATHQESSSTELSQQSKSLSSSYSNPLVNLLKENNRQMLENVNNLIRAPYILYEKDIQKITRHMVATQKLIQTSCQTIQKLSNESDQLNRAFETLTLDIFQQHKSLRS